MKQLNELKLPKHVTEVITALVNTGSTKIAIGYLIALGRHSTDPEFKLAAMIESCSIIEIEKAVNFNWMTAITEGLKLTSEDVVAMYREGVRRAEQRVSINMKNSGHPNKMTDSEFNELVDMFDGVIDGKPH